MWVALPIFFIVRVLQQGGRLAAPSDPSDAAGCASTAQSNVPSELACFTLLGMAPVLVPLRPSSEATDDPSKLARYLSRDGG